MKAWKGEDIADHEFKEFKDLIHSNNSRGYLVLVNKIIQQFRNIGKLHIYNEKGYDNVVGIIQECCVYTPNRKARSLITPPQ